MSRNLFTREGDLWLLNDKNKRLMNVQLYFPLLPTIAVGWFNGKTFFHSAQPQFDFSLSASDDAHQWNQLENNRSWLSHDFILLLPFNQPSLRHIFPNIFIFISICKDLKLNKQFIQSFTRWFPMFWVLVGWTRHFGRLKNGNLFKIQINLSLWSLTRVNSHSKLICCPLKLFDSAIIQFLSHERTIEDTFDGNLWKVINCV